MQNVLKLPLALCVLLSTSIIIQHPVQARMHHIWFDDTSLFDPAWMDDVKDFYRKSVKSMKQHFEDIGPSKEDREVIKAARENLAKIKHDIQEDDQKVTISFSGFESLDKKDIKVVKKKHGWAGTISTKDGALEFFITPRGIDVARCIELKKTEKDDKDAQKKRVFYSSSLTSEGESFKQLVDITSLKAEAIKDNTFTLTIGKQKEETLQIP